MIRKPLASTARTVLDLLGDACDRVTGRRDALTPPRRLQFVGGGDFRAVGQHFLHLFREVGDLRPDERVLDVGCGVGRIAAALTGYLSTKARYEGFDVVPEAIRWCQRAITSRHPNFRFQLADLYNKAYNPRGRQSASSFTFPYGDGEFDFAFLTSVFTHMLPADTDRYLAEIARVLAPGGRCFATFFLLDEEALRLIGEGKSTRPMGHQLGSCRVDNPKVPELAVGYPEAEAAALFAKHGLVIRQPVLHGKWCGRPDAPSYQDIITAARPPAGATGAA